MVFSEPWFARTWICELVQTELLACQAVTYNITASPLPQTEKAPFGSQPPIDFGHLAKSSGVIGSFEVRALVPSDISDLKSKICPY